MRIYSFATDLNTNYELLYANDEADVAGYLWFALTLIGLSIAFVGIAFNLSNENILLWSRLYILCGFILVTATLCSFYGNDENVCHQEESIIGMSPIYAVISATFYLAAALIPNLKDRNFGKIPGAQLFGFNLLLARLSERFSGIKKDDLKF